MANYILRTSTSNDDITTSTATELNILTGVSIVNSAVFVTSVGGVTSFSTTLPAGLTIPGYATTASASGIVNSGLVNQLAWYASSGTTLSGLSTSANGVLVTSAGSVPSISTTLPSGLTIPDYIPSATASTTGTVLISNGSAYVASTSIWPNTVGTSGKVVISNGTSNTYSTPTFPNASATSGKLIQSDGTNWIASTATWPTAATSGKFVIGNGTNYVESTSTIPTSAGATANKVLLSDGTNYVLSIPTFPNASATSGKITISDGTNWIASTPTYPNSATGTGTILRADGTNWVATTATYPATTTINRILYSSANNVVSEITTANSSVMVTSSGGVPSLSTSLPSGLTIPGYAASGANANITSMSGLTGYLQAPTGIKDANGNIELAFSSVASAVNYITISNNSTGNRPSLTVTGDAALGLTIGVKNDVIRLIDTTTTSAPAFRWYEANATNYIALRAPTSLSGSLTFTLPAIDAATANYPLVSNGSATLSFLRQPAASVQQSNTSIAANGFTKVTFATENYDIGGYMSSTTYTPLVAGIYNFFATITFNATTASTRYGIYIYKNGSALKGAIGTPAGTNGQSFTISGSTIMNGSTDTLEVYGWNNHATVAQALDNGSTSNFFDVSYMGPSS